MEDHFFKYLNDNNIEYVLLNSNHTSEDLSHDIDILFQEEAFSNLKGILDHFSEKQDCKIVQMYHQEQFAKNFFIWNPKTNKLLNLDCYGSLNFKGTKFHDEASLFNSKRFYNDKYYLSESIEFFYYLLKKSRKGDLESAISHLDALFQLDKEGANQILKKHLSKYEELIQRSFETKSYDKLIQSQAQIVADIKGQASSLPDTIKDKLRILGRILNPTGITISFLGPDGSGKSTIINGLKKQQLPYRKVAYFHLKPIHSKESSVTSDPHAAKPYSLVVSIIKIIFFFFQYSWNWLKTIVPLKIRSTLIIFDRYYDDVIVDPKRFRLSGINMLSKIVKPLIPRPQLYFILYADADTIYERKKEIPLNELGHQLKIYKSFSKDKRYHLINVDRPVLDIVNEVYAILMNTMHERY
ncbi:MAG: hypothetical protein ACWA5P_01230 [bacterium]